MAKWQGYFKVVTPQVGTTSMTDNQEIGSQGAYTNYTWYQRLVQGSASRLTRYREYDLMDNDVEIARALDTIAEEIIGNDPQEDTPIEASFKDTELKSIPSSDVMTIKTALQFWCEQNRLDIRLFSISRNLVKYGDCFFTRRTPTSSWEYVHPKNVIAAIVDEDDMTSVIGWQIRKDFKKPNDPSSQSTGGYSPTTGQNVDNFSIIPAAGMLRFTLNDDMSESAPFGESVLRTVYRTQKQKELLEDAIIIYRIRTAPERKVHYIEVGKVPPQRIKTILEQYKNEIRQKKVPTFGGGVDQIDSVYNPHSMNEDYFMAQRDGKGGRIETLPGGQGLGELSDLEYFQKKVWKGLRVPASYMMDTDGAGVYNDGATGVAYIQELRFSLFIKRIQMHVNEVLDKEFKSYLQTVGIAITNPDSYNLTLPDPENFGIYRQQKLYSDLLGTYSQADGIRHLSKRFAMLKFMQLTAEDIAENERMKFEELGINPDDPTEAKMELIYGDPAEGGDMGGMGGGMGGMGGMGDMSAGGLGGDDIAMTGDEGGDMGGADLGAPPADDGGAGAPDTGGLPPP